MPRLSLMNESYDRVALTFQVLMTFVSFIGFSASTWDSVPGTHTSCIIQPWSLHLWNPMFCTCLERFKLFTMLMIKQLFTRGRPNINESFLPKNENAQPFKITSQFEKKFQWSSNNSFKLRESRTCAELSTQPNVIKQKFNRVNFENSIRKMTSFRTPCEVLLRKSNLIIFC